MRSEEKLRHPPKLNKDICHYFRRYFPIPTEEEEKIYKKIIKL
jgi:hypothetical protein